MAFGTDLELLLRARYPIIAIGALAEEEVEAEVAEVAKRLGRSLYIWDFVEGYQGSPTNQGVGKRNPLQALEFLDKIEGGAVFLLRDGDRFWEDVAVSRKLRNLARRLKQLPQNLILLVTTKTVPEFLREVVTVIDFPLPSADRIRQELQNFGVKEQELLEELTRACQGLSLERLRRVLSLAIADHGELRHGDGQLILAEKRQSIRQTEILDFFPDTTGIDDIGGLDNLKEWLLRRGNAFSDRARQYGIPYPRGLLLVGIQGTGKSLTAKAIAHHWSLPLLRLDVGRLFAGLVGESEARTRQMTQLAEAMAPCVLWVDEIDKAFSGDGRGDGGTTNRVFATFLTWMAEKTAPVFVVATANNIRALPPELLRKGRFDEIFFVGLPNQEERAQIFAVHLNRVRGYNLRNYDLDRLAYETPNFSGAEIEQVIIEAMHIGFSQNRDFTTEDILEAASQIVPLAQTASAEVEYLQEWAKSGKARLASRSALFRD
ncbi:MAG: AAA family ATPase [Pseudanabaenaceae cyanobacterium SKYGB_i_bin29]|nr:AAA family ATPase [Pseudanabaenaceae cyanobacterium SKYG29]MDW8421199.1 AAA family ATPase [Pseudanabaenaceae cyanobacterium SKYGB_i_bin29]